MTRVVQRRILNACTTKPRTAHQIEALLCLPRTTVNDGIRTLLKRGELLPAGLYKAPLKRNCRLYSAKRTIITPPTLTVWRGPTPTEWGIQ